MKILEPQKLGRGVTIASVGAQVGSQHIDNETLHRRGYPEPPDRITRLTGMTSRHHVADESTSELAAGACVDALRRVDARAEELDQLIVSTSSPDRLIPSIGSTVHGLLGMQSGPAHSISATCSGFLFGLDIGARAILTGEEHVMVCASEARSTQVDITDRSTGALFGDAAGAALLRPCAPGEGILAIGIDSTSSGEDTVVLGRDRQDRLEMRDGARVYFEAVEGMKKVGQALLDSQSLTWDDLDWVIPHQANGRILKRFCWLAGLDPAKAWSNLQTHGNTSSASIPVALSRALAESIRPGQLVLLIAVGAGFTAGAALLRVDEALVMAAKRALTPREDV